MRAPLLLVVLLAPLLAPLLAALPSAGAQGALDPHVQLEVLPFDGMATPLGGPVFAQGRVVAVFQSPPVGAARVDLAVAGAPAWASVALEPESVELEVAPTGSGGWRGEASFTLRATVGLDAPAFAGEPVLVSASLRATASTGAAGAEAGTTLMPAYLPRLELAPLPTVVHLPAGGQAELPVRVENRGNGNTRVWIEVASSGDVSVALPGTRVLASRAHGGESSEATQLKVSLAAPGSFDRPQAVHLRIRHAYALDAALEGEPVDVRFVIDPHGGSSPGAAGGGGRLLPGWPAPGGDTVASHRTADAPAWAEDADGAAFPVAGTLAGGAVGLALARRRLRDG